MWYIYKIFKIIESRSSVVGSKNGDFRSIYVNKMIFDVKV